MSGYVPCHFTPGQTVRYRQGSDNAERTIVEVVARHEKGFDSEADGVIVRDSYGRDSHVIPASWFEAAE